MMIPKYLLSKIIWNDIASLKEIILVKIHICDYLEPQTFSMLNTELKEWYKVWLQMQELNC